MTAVVPAAGGSHRRAAVQRPDALPAGRGRARPPAPPPGRPAADRRAPGDPGRAAGRRSPAARDRAGALSAVPTPTRRPLALAVSGLVWAVVLFAGVATGPALVAVILAPVVLVAALSGVRAAASEGGAGRLPRLQPKITLLAPMLLAGLTPLAAIAGPLAAVVVVAAAVAAALAQHVAPGAALRRVVLAVAGPAVAGASVVLADRQGTEIAVVMVTAILLFDLANAVMGTGSTGGPLGWVSAALSLAVLAVVVEAVMSPPFAGVSPGVLCGAVAVLAPAGVWLCWRLVPRRLPALRRLDSLVLAGPVWVIATWLLIQR